MIIITKAKIHLNFLKRKLRAKTSFCPAFDFLCICCITESEKLVYFLRLLLCLINISRMIRVFEISPTTNGFLLSEHILCKESIAIAKKVDFEILAYLYVFRSPEFIYAIFVVLYECMCVCVCMCM